MIQLLIVAVEQANVSWPASWDILTNEMKRFEYAISPSGAITYSAPAGFHDDCVVALALVNRGRHEYQASGSMFSMMRAHNEARVLI